MKRLVSMMAVLFLMTFSLESFARITEVADLIQQARNMKWSNQDNVLLEYNVKDEAYGAASLGEKARLGVTRSGSSYVVPGLTQPVLELAPAPTLGRRDTRVVGAYEIHLPDLKRIQFELFYDLLADSRGDHGDIKLSLEVEVKNQSASGQWRTADRFDGDITAEKIRQAPLQSIGDETFSSHSFVAVLSQYRNQDVRLKIAAEAPRSVVTSQKCRVTHARLMALDFDFAFGNPYYVDRDGNTWPAETAPAQSLKKTSSKKPGFSLQSELGGMKKASNATNTLSAVFVNGTTETVSLMRSTANPPSSPFDSGDIYTCPDGGITCIWWWDSNHIFSNQVAYFGAVRKDNPTDGTFCFDFDLYDKLQYADEADLQDYLLKDGSSRPQQVLIPAADPGEELDHYISITGTVTGYDGPYQYVHAFCSAEDKYDAIYSNPPEKYSDKYPGRCETYSRIVYARSSNSTSFTRMHDSSGSLVDGATPVLTHWQSEAIAFHPASTTFVLTGGPISGPTYEPLSFVGVGGPSVIELGDYYYMFYTRWWDTREQSRDPSVTVAYPDYGWNSFISSVTLAGTTPSSSDPEWADWIRYWARENVCVARAPKYNVNYSAYASNSNPWTKHHEYYTGSGRADEWTSAINGLDTAVLPDPGVYGKVSWNTYLERYVMITMDAQNYGYFYIQEATNPAKTDWHDMILNDWSPRIAIDMADVEKGYEKRISYPTIVGDTDKTTARYNAMYYAMEVNDDIVGDSDGTIHDGFVTGTHYMRRVTSFEFVK